MYTKTDIESTLHILENYFPEKQEEYNLFKVVHGIIKQLHVSEDDIKKLKKFNLYSDFNGVDVNLIPKIDENGEYMYSKEVEEILNKINGGGVK